MEMCQNPCLEVNHFIRLLIGKYENLKMFTKYLLFPTIPVTKNECYIPFIKFLEMP